jgi:hypothetical protein
MRALVSASVLVVVAAAGCSTTGAGTGQTASGNPVQDLATVGNLIQVMRGSVFRDANIIFDVQQMDPGAPIKPHNTGAGETTTSAFSNVYAGWQVVENAAVMLHEAVDLMLKPRMCENGIPAPVGQADFRKTAEGLRSVATDILKASQEKNRDKVIELTEPLSDACAACHKIYRDPEGPKGFGDNSIRCKVPATATD